MTSNSRKLFFLAAAASAIAAALQLYVRDWLRGANGLLIAACVTLIATGVTERSTAGKWITYVLLAGAFVLLGMRLLGS